MDSLPLLDIIVLGVMLASLLLGISRGFVREVLSLLSWIGAAVIAWFSYPLVAELLVDFIPNSFLRNLIGGALAFIGAVIVLGIVANPLRRAADLPFLGGINGAAGAVFGLLRGYLVCCLLFAAAYWIWEERKPPPFLEEGKLRPYIASGASWMVDTLSSFEDTPLSRRLRDLSNTGGIALKLHQKLLQPDTVASPDPKNSQDQGYNTQSRQQLDSLFQE